MKCLHTYILRSPKKLRCCMSRIPINVMFNFENQANKKIKLFLNKISGKSPFAQ